MCSPRVHWQLTPWWGIRLDGGALARARCEPGLLPGFMAVDTLKVEGLGSKGLE